MKIGFIGAGRVGFSMGKYLSTPGMKENGTEVTGYCSRSPDASVRAARFTDTKQYLTYEELVRDSDVVFLSVNDSAIAPVWEQIRTCSVAGKLICHFSGALSSDVFSGITRRKAYGYSIHPLLAIHDRYESYRKLSEAFFTIEGSDERLSEVLAMVRSWGNQAAVIDRADKMRYHAACAIASNLSVGLVHLSEQILTGCGFNAQEAHHALCALIEGNTANIIKEGTAGALTGPLERNDVSTVQAHLACLTSEQAQIYRLLSLQVLQAAQEKHPGRDYEAMQCLLRGNE